MFFSFLLRLAQQYYTMIPKDKVLFFDLFNRSKSLNKNSRERAGYFPHPVVYSLLAFANGADSRP
jgi:hypothetical protein